MNFHAGTGFECSRQGLGGVKNLMDRAFTRNPAEVIRSLARAAAYHACENGSGTALTCAAAVSGVGVDRALARESAAVEKVEIWT